MFQRRGSPGRDLRALIPRPTGVTRQATRRSSRPGGKWGGQDNGRPIRFGPPRTYASNTVIHIELDRVRHHLEPLYLFHLQLEIGIDRVVREHVALLQEGAVLVERFAGL